MKEMPAMNNKYECVAGYDFDDLRQHVEDCEGCFLIYFDALKCEMETVACFVQDYNRDAMSHEMFEVENEAGKELW